jgi:hypothetical protein
MGVPCNEIVKCYKMHIYKFVIVSYERLAIKFFMFVNKAIKEKGPALFDSSSEDEEDGDKDEARFRVRREFEGKAGKKVYENVYKQSNY